MKVSYGAFSLQFLNPPFDDEFGGGQRTEVEFLRQATPWLKPGGVLCFVCPERVVLGYNADLRFGGEPYSDAADFLKTYYDQVTVLKKFPEEVRKFKEVVVLAVKRKEPVESHAVEVARRAGGTRPPLRGPGRRSRRGSSRLSLPRRNCGPCWVAVRCERCWRFRMNGRWPVRHCR